ncbi:hypothetical protein [Glycomyces paridis]|uniref:Uncharacterized protein n=1 Tax=Glycomyces paridis TaxID=2126555 RepID=A0A4S8P8P6_9ACTN|nr:hypothetical protein [Glycomyces paridis]THV25975.1 hypothetical protein E9998_19775 [Glycomyces paridis]
MTMIDHHTPAWHTTAEDEVTGLRRALAAAELRAMKSAAAEDSAQFAFECARRRADRAEAALRALLVEHVVLPNVPEHLENSAVALADVLVDDIAAGTLLDELDLAGHVADWSEYEADGFTPRGVEVPF